jgi:hypothetical protein
MAIQHWQQYLGIHIKNYQWRLSFPEETPWVEIGQRFFAPGCNSVRNWSITQLVLLLFLKFQIDNENVPSIYFIDWSVFLYSIMPSYNVYIKPMTAFYTNEL